MLHLLRSQWRLLGGCYVPPRPAIFGKKVFFSHTRLTPNNKIYATYTKKNSIEKNAIYAKKKKLRDLRQKKKERVMLISTIELRFPRLERTADTQFQWLPLMNLMGM